uniref:EF-hand domain-containing protein n=1 Tax=Oryza punctata TaxID=4537 RepID=A0A0E0K4Z2_ORYPU
MDTRRRRLSPAVAVAAFLFFPMFFGSQPAAAYGEASGAAGMTALQKHAAFFDKDNDGFVSPTETYEGLRALGLGAGFSSLSAALINGILPLQTRPDNATSPRFSIYIENIHKAIHRSDSGTYDSEGRFVPEKFEEIFTKHAKTVPDALTSDEIDELLQANRKPNDYAGWVGASAEWKILYSVGKDKDGLLRKDAVREVYDGSLFAKLGGHLDRGHTQPREFVAVNARDSRAEKKPPATHARARATMDAQRRRLSPAVAAAALLFFPMFFGSHPAAAAEYGEASGYDGMTALQKHAAFFDKDSDGIISLSETYDGLRALGLGTGLSSLSAAFINGVLSPKTRPDNATAPRLSIYIENIHKGIHGSDSGTYDSEGRFVAEKFEEIFAKHAKTVPDALTSDEIDELLQANRKPSDYSGWVAASSEWKMLYKLGKDKDGLLRKDAVREVYDGNLFAKLVAARRYEENQA